MRKRAARGTLVNAAFLVGLNLLGFLKGFAVAAFLSVSDYGVWGLLIVSFATLLVLVQVGVDDKYIQQDAPDQELAFQQAFTLQCLLCGVFVGVIALAMPLYAMAYDNWEILLPGYALALAMPAMALQAPLWTFYRRLDYVRQRRLQAIDPIVGLVVTIGLAAAGFRYWSLVLGVVCGSWAAALVAVRASPYRLRLRYSRGTMREYTAFSAPLFLGAFGALLIAQVPILVAQRSVGIAGVGAIAIASTISNYANRVDDVVTNTLYPAICAVKDRMELLEEAFMKSNRLALLWATPTGFGAVLFAPDLVAYVLGERWHVAIFAIQAFGLTAAINQIGFNWTAFFRALGTTRPLAVYSAATFAGVMAFAIPLLLVHGINGFAVGMGIAVVLSVAVRVGYLARLFPLSAILRNSARGMAPAVPALLAVLAVRDLMDVHGRGTADVIIELAVFLIVTILATSASERELLREFRGYLRPQTHSAPVAAQQ